MRGVVAWLAVVVGGCAADDEPVPASPPPRIATGPTTLPDPPSEPTTTVRLIEPGAEPRRPLRYRPRVGDVRTLVFEHAFGVAMSSGGHRMFGQDSTSRGRIRLVVTAIDARGDVSVEMEILEMTAPSFDPIQLAPLAPELIGKRGTFVMSDRGALLSAQLPQIPDEARDLLYLLDYMIVLPDEPVGLGATWESRSLALRNGFAMDHSETHRLTALDATGGETRSSHEQRASPQVVPDLSPFDALTLFELKSLESRGSGSYRFELDRVLPLRSRSDVAFDMEMTILGPGGNQPVTMTMTIGQVTSLQ